MLQLAAWASVSAGPEAESPRIHRLPRPAQVCPPPRTSSPLRPRGPGEVLLANLWLGLAPVLSRALDLNFVLLRTAVIFQIP